MLATEALKEADRLMTVCNSCRYCEGVCAVFPAMERRRAFNAGDLEYLANLCHGCGACFIDCQFTEPHEFNVNVPRGLAALRAETWAAHAWPRALAPLYARNGTAVALIAAASVVGFLFLLAPMAPATGSFYAVMPHAAMAWLFGVAFLYAAVALLMSARGFWRAIDEPAATLGDATSLWQAIRDAGSLRYLDGGGAGCHQGQARGADRRRLFHHFTFYGFVLCFAATGVATMYHYLPGREAPYAPYDLPVLLGVAGGLGLVAGPAGLLFEREKTDPALKDPASAGMDRAFILMLFFAGATGLILLALRETVAMPALLAAHLGVVFALFVTMPYGKMVHGLYRWLALVKYAREARTPVGDE